MTLVTEHPAPGRAGEEIAIVGMDCVYPGAKDRHDYWRNILAGKNFIGDPPNDWDKDFYLDPESTENDRIYTAQGGFLGELSSFHPLQHSVMPNSVDGGEPDQFLALELAQRALEDADYFSRPLPGDRVQIVLGRGTYINRGFTTVVQHGIVIDRVLDILKTLHPEHDAAELRAIKQELKASLPPFNAQMAPALVPNLVTGRIANRLDFQGVNYIVDAACASSHVAVQRGWEDLQTGRCDLAIVGGVHASTPPPIYMIFCQLEAIAKSGRIRPFDKGADGTLLGEGVGILVLKRRRDAEAAGDRIYALLRSVGIASDGKALGILAPRLEGEVLALERAYREAAIDPSSVGLIEAHGTGTPVGDATEVRSLTQVLGKRKYQQPHCALGTVKSMIGHCLPGAGAAGMIKAALALYHRVLPPTLNCEDPLDELRSSDTPLYINTAARPWVHGAVTPRRAGVNAFGFGGINAHAILEEYPGPQRETPKLPLPAELLMVTGADQKQLSDQARRLMDRLSVEGASVSRLAAESCHQPAAGDQRLVVVASDREDALGKLAKAIEKLARPDCQRIRNRNGIYYFAEPFGKDARIALLFPGEGSQYPEMLAGLCLHFPTVLRWFDRIDRAFVDHPRKLLPSQVIFPAPAAASGAGESLWRMDIGPETIFAANQAMYSLIQLFEIPVHMICGHSTGEYSALYAAGANRFDNDSALARDILALNRQYESLAEQGLLVQGWLITVAGIAQRELLEILDQREDLYLAMDNCPNQQVICALSEESARWLEEQLAQVMALTSRLPFDRAYHTAAFQPFCAALTSFINQLDFHVPDVPLYSCVTAAPMDADVEEIRRLSVGQWAERVRFRETVQRMHDDGARIFIECGPRNNLTGFVDDILKGQPHVALSMDDPSRDSAAQLCHLLAQLWAQGVALDLEVLYPRETGVAEKSSLRKIPDRPMKLKNGLQPLHLDPARSHSRPVPKPPVNSTLAELPLAAPSQPAATPRIIGTAQGVSAAMTLGETFQPVGSDSARLLGEYFQTMENFLGSQQQVMTTFLRRLGTPLDAPSGVSIPVADVSRLPLLGTVRERIPSQRLVTVLEVSPESHLYLTDHTMGRDLSRLSPGLGGIPIIPLTFSIEILAEAAAALFPGYRVTRLEEVRASRWLTPDQGVLRLEVEAVTRSGSPVPRVKVTIRDVEQRNHATKPRPRPVWVEAEVLLSREAPAAQTATAYPWRGERKSRWRPEQIYQEIMFHGPKLRAIVSMDLWAENGSRATLNGMPHDRLLRDDPDPRFVTDAISLDAAGQVIGMWTADHLSRAFHVFPFRCEKIEILDTNLLPGETATCQARIELVGETEVRSDIEIYRADGRISTRLSGWWDKRFDLPEAFFRLRRAPAEAMVGREYREALRTIDPQERLHCWMVDGLGSDFLRSSGAIWLRALAFIVLGEDERREWWALNSEPARLDRVLGRSAVKDALRQLLADRGRRGIAAVDIAIGNREDGAPVVTDWPGEWGDEPRISLAHKNGMAVAVAVNREDCAGIGIDLEAIEARSAAFVGEAFSATEQRLLAGADAREAAEWQTRVWCAKEATGKALGLGLSELLPGVEVTCLDLATGRGETRFSAAGGEQRARVQTWREGGHIVALAILE